MPNYYMLVEMMGIQTTDVVRFHLGVHDVGSMKDVCEILHQLAFG